MNHSSSVSQVSKTGLNRQGRSVKTQQWNRCVYDWLFAVVRCYNIQSLTPASQKFATTDRSATLRCSSIIKRGRHCCQSAWRVARAATGATDRTKQAPESTTLRTPSKLMNKSV